MREKDLKRILQQPYSFENLKELIPLFFKFTFFLISKFTIPHGIFYLFFVSNPVSSSIK